MALPITMEVVFLRTARESAFKGGLTHNDLKKIADDLGHDPLKGSVSQYPPIMELKWRLGLKIYYVFKSQTEILVVAMAFNGNKDEHLASKAKVESLIKDLLKKGIITFAIKELVDNFDLDDFPGHLIEWVKKLFTRS